MVRLKHSEEEALSRALLQLYRPCTLEDFPKRLLAALDECLSCDIYCYTELHQNGTARVEAKPSYRVSQDIFARYLHQHPSLNAIVERQILPPVKISDFCTLAQWQRTDLYNQYFRSENQKHQVGFLSLNQFPRFGASLNRSTGDFSEEEKQILELLRPHIVQAHENARIYGLLGKGLEAEGSAFLIARRVTGILRRHALPSAVLKSWWGRRRRRVNSIYR